MSRPEYHTISAPLDQPWTYGRSRDDVDNAVNRSIQPNELPYRPISTPDLPPPLPPVPPSLRPSHSTLFGPRPTRSLTPVPRRENSLGPAPTIPPKASNHLSQGGDNKYSEPAPLPPHLPPPLPPKIPVPDGSSAVPVASPTSDDPSELQAFQDDLQRALDLSREQQALEERQRREQEAHDLALAIAESADMLRRHQTQHHEADFQGKQSETPKISGPLTKESAGDTGMSVPLPGYHTEAPLKSTPPDSNHSPTQTIHLGSTSRVADLPDHEVAEAAQTSPTISIQSFVVESPVTMQKLDHVHVHDMAAPSPHAMFRSRSSIGLQGSIILDELLTKRPSNLGWEKLNVPTPLPRRATSPQARPKVTYIDRELLQGVSIAFNPPMISPSLTINMPRGMPGIIALPYGRAPPLHILAPNWRQLLNLLARSADTRIEPSVEAISTIGQTECNLRTVIQFVRVHHSSTDWRTLVYLTIDHPVPPHVPNAAKYTSGDANTLPWSYTLSALPTLLHDGPDALLTKSYTVPKTASCPYPTLPIDMPTLAMYLQAVLEDSRRASGPSDSNGGIKKLARLVDTFYPVDDADDDGSEGESPRKNLFTRFGRSRKVKDRGRGNADTYEMITPFRLDEWG